MQMFPFQSFKSHMADVLAVCVNKVHYIHTSQELVICKACKLSPQNNFAFLQSVFSNLQYFLTCFMLKKKKNKSRLVSKSSETSL